jgi:hypothetical protein
MALPSKDLTEKTFATVKKWQNHIGQHVEVFTFGERVPVKVKR